MATISVRTRKDGSTAYTATIRLRKDGRLAHSESRSFDSRERSAAWADARERSLMTSLHGTSGTPSDDRQEMTMGTRRAPRMDATDGAVIPRRVGMDTLDGLSLQVAQFGNMTVADVFHRYILEKETTEPLGRTKRHHLLQMARSRLGSVPVLSLGSDQVVYHVRERRATATSASTVNNDLIWLRVVLRYARLAWGVPVDMDVVDQAAALCKSERLVKRSGKRRRRPTVTEMHQLENHFIPLARRINTPPMYLMYWFAIHSCRRLSEICSMRLSDFDETNMVWKVCDMKHPDGSRGNDHWAWITPDALPIIHAAIKDIKRTPQDDRLFPVDPKSISTYWTRNMHVIGVHDLHFHDLRHEGCSRLAEMGWSIPEIQKVSLHESWNSLQIYVNMQALTPRNTRLLGVAKTELDAPAFRLDLWDEAMRVRKGHASGGPVGAVNNRQEGVSKKRR
jgi:integrase